nr:MAG TPA: hypothetical protein [Caudoviricetes sp.]
MALLLCAWLLFVRLGAVTVRGVDYIQSFIKQILDVNMKKNFSKITRWRN